MLEWCSGKHASPESERKEFCPPQSHPPLPSGLYCTTHYSHSHTWAELIATSFLPPPGRSIRNVFRAVNTNSIVLVSAAGDPGFESQLEPKYLFFSFLAIAPEVGLVRGIHFSPGGLILPALFGR